MNHVKRVSFVLFGGTGDLTRKKLSAAFARLIKDKKLDKRSSLIGVSRKDLTDNEYKEFLINSVKSKEDKKFLSKLNIRYVKGDFSRKGGLVDLKKTLDKIESKNCDRIYYLSTSFKFFPKIADELRRIGLHKVPHGKIKILFEKPFGDDLKSSDKLNRNLKKFFSEDQIYRIDHYLAKDTVQNLIVLKYTNPILYSTLNNKYVKSIEVIIDEDLGVGNRLEYYNEVGAIKDMIQNHLLQILSLLLIGRPKEINSKSIHEEKTKILKSLRVLPSRNHLLGQYESYSKEVKNSHLKNNKTETFSKIVLESKDKNWKGVKIILRTGKKLKKKFGQININFKCDKKVDEFFDMVHMNQIQIKIYPKQDINIYLNTKDPFSNELRLANLEFCKECTFGPNTPDEYSTLLEEVLKGDKTLFARDDEIREAWKIVEKIDKIKPYIKFVKYKDNTDPENKKV